jgi:hypothetical protein
MPTQPSHVSRLDLELRRLLAERPVAALGTLDESGAPFVSMVPFAVEPASGCLVLHVSALAAHTRQMQAQPRVSLLVMGADDWAESPQALPRVTISARAEFTARDSEAERPLRAAYLARHPQSELMTQLPDFAFVRLAPTAARHVAGFGAARSVALDELARVLAGIAVP